MLNDKKVILQVFSRTSRGGAESSAMNYYRNINRDKVQFYFVKHTEDICDFDQEILKLGGKVLSIPKYKIVNHFSYVQSWNELFKKYHEIDIVHGHYFTLSAIYLNVAKKYYKITIAHSHTEMKGMLSIILKLVTFPLRYTADYLFACSLNAGKFLFGKKAIKMQNFKVMFNAIDLDKFKFNQLNRDKIRKELNLGDSFVIGQVGNFSKTKNHKFTLQLFSEFIKEKPNSILVFVGEGGLRSEIELLAQQLNIVDHIRLTSTRSDIPELLSAFDVFILPSLFEGLPVVLVEAQANGLDCIVSKNITSEIFITDLIKYENNNFDVIDWIQLLLHTSKEKNRVSYSQKLEHSSYDIKSQAKILENFYLEAK